MQKLEKIAEQIRQTFDAQTATRDKALGQARALTRACALSIRAVHRDEDGGDAGPPGRGPHAGRLPAHRPN